MPINILMPALSPTMEKGNLAKWLKKEGDKVKSGDVIAEIETDKATMEVEAVDEGTIAKILVPEGTQDVAVNDVIAVLAGDGEDVKAAGAGAASAPPKAAAAAVRRPPAAAPADAVTSRTARQRRRRLPPQLRRHRAAARLRKTNGHARTFSSPLARRLAKEAGIELGAHQRFRPAWPRHRARCRGSQIRQGAEGACRSAGRRAVDRARRGCAPCRTSRFCALFEAGSYEVVPHDGMRRTIAQRLTASVQTVPHFYLTMDCDIGKLLAAREEINAAAPKDKEKKPLYKLSVNDFVIKAMAIALQRIPNCNVSWTEGGMLKHKHSDIGVAVAMPGGLITPIIRKAETKSLSTISGEMKDFAARARARKLKPEEYQGGTTAVSNLGMYGIKDFTAVINPPHATILAVGTSEERAVVRNGKIEIAHIMSVTLSCDHRAVDGALGAELIGAFKMLIENPVMMMV